MARIGSAITMRVAALLLLALSAVLPARQAHAFTPDELIDGFNRTVFGSEYLSLGWQSFIVKKYVEPVRMQIEDRSESGRGQEIRDFVATLPAEIRGLRISIIPSAEEANYRVFLVDRVEYQNVVASQIYDGQLASSAPGKCLVRIVSTASGITRSDAVIVADEGDFLFHRCMVEEILQGLGPVNDDATLAESVFNDQSRKAVFTDFDRHLLNMLYDPRIRPGMMKLEAQRILPAVAAETIERLRR